MEHVPGPSAYLAGSRLPPALLQGALQAVNLAFEREVGADNLVVATASNTEHNALGIRPPRGDSGWTCKPKLTHPF